MKETTKTDIDSAQFKRWMKAKGISLRRLAAEMRVDPSTMTYILKGTRAIKRHEYEQFARLLEVPIEDVLRAAGVPLPTSQARQVPLAAHYDGESVTNIEPTEHMPAPPDVPDDAIGILCRTARSPAEALDGWLLFTAPRTATNNQALNRLCLVWLKCGKQVLAYVKRGYRPHSFNLQPIAGVPLENVVIEFFAPILWIRP